MAIASKSPEQGYSIRRFLTGYLLLAVLVMTALSSAWVYHDAAREVEELFDASLAQSARVLHGMITRKGIEEHKDHLLESLTNKDLDFEKYAVEATPHGHKYEKKVSFQVWSPEGELLLRSASISDHLLSELVQGFEYNLVNGKLWRTFTIFSSHDNYWLIVGESDEIRAELTHDIARDHMVPVLLCLPLLASLIWFTISQGLFPLRRIAQEVGRQDYERLGVIEGLKTPVEVKGLLNAINDLFARLNQSYQREQRFVSDAAHELRNPLAALMVHADNTKEDIEAGASKQELSSSIAGITTSISRLSRLVSQLLQLSRTDVEYLTDKSSVVDLGLLVEDICQQFAKPLEAKRQVLEFSGEPDIALIGGNESLLASLLRNLMDNASRYTPEGGHIQVKVERIGESAELLVADSGPGIDESEIEQVQERFYRVTGSGESGSGLGLSIVKQVVGVHGADLELSRSELGGLAIKVVFPLAETP